MLPKLIFALLGQLLFWETAWARSLLESAPKLLFSESADARSLLKSAPQLCPIDLGNLLDVQLFVSSANQCFDSCEKKEDCNYYR